MGYYEKVPSDAETESTPLRAEYGATNANAAAVLRLQIILVCCAYAIVGPTLVLVNNHILKQLQFPFPLILSTLGLITTAVTCATILHVLPRVRRVLSRTGSKVGVVRAPSPRRADTPSTPVSPGHEGGSEALELPAQITFHFWLWNMVPIGAAQGLTFAATNAAYMYLTITFTQMLAAFTPTVTLVLLYLSGIEVPTRRASCSVLVIGVGCAMSSIGEGHFHPVGVAFRSVGILAEATRLVLTQKLLKNHKLSIFESQFYLAPVGAAFLLCGAFFTELHSFESQEAWSVIMAHPGLFAASALLGVAASMLTFLVIKLTNSVTLKVINTARNAGFVLFTVVVLGEHASTIQVFGYGISVAAFSCYTYFKIHKM